MASPLHATKRMVPNRHDLHLTAWNCSHIALSTVSIVDARSWKDESMSSHNSFKIALILFIVGVLGSTVGPLVSKWSSDVSMGQKILSRRFVYEKSLSPGVEVVIDVPGGISPVMLEFNVKMNASDLDISDAFVVKTPFEMSYQCNLPSGEPVYSGVEPGNLYAMRDHYITNSAGENPSAEIISRDMVYRAVDMGTFQVKATLSTPPGRAYESAVLRVYDQIPSLDIILISMLFLQFISLPLGSIGFFWFVSLTRRERFCITKIS